ncbi:MAG TPA: EAL domain-containing protein [Rhodoferax sp.]|jgi:diguanylate cyclase (GGDEF)-like protein|nr:EAL domain-containing protein [Rhodoferax sp.]
MSWHHRLLGRLRLRWRGGLPLRYTMAAVVVLGVTLPGLVFFAVEQRLAEKSQNALLERSENAFMAISRVSIGEAMWAIDRNALDAALNRILDNPQVVAVRVDDALAGTSSMERRRAGYSLSLAEETDARRLRRLEQRVDRSGETLGSVTVWFDMAYGQNLLLQRRSEMLLLVALQVLASLMVLMPLLVSRVLKPIERLKEQASALLERTPAQAHAPFVWRRNDELGLLGRHLGQVQAQLRELFAQLQSKNEQLQQLALYDHLTGLPNRALFTDLVQREILLARRTQQQFAVLFIDLDRFKAVNDTMGHAAGDALLVELARRLREVLRDVDVVCRQSGDEFLVLVRNVEHWEWLGEVADRILQVVEGPVGLANGAARISASIGIARFPDDAEDFEPLVKCADIAMYQAKSLGRARYSFFHSELNAQLLAHMELEKQLAQAIRGGELVLHYQPQVDAVSGVLVGLEALVRWKHPERGLLFPGQFIAVAEESGLIAEMGVWTLREACRQQALWKARGLQVGTMAVNVSALEFRDHRLLDSLQAALQESGVSPGELEVEITESVLMAETDTSLRIIARLHELGVGIAIDDFGTGYSSLSYLKRLRPTQLKIDRSFVRDADTDSDSRAIVTGVISLAKALGLNMVAEGVETEQQRQFLRDAGCHTLQGFLIARPLAVDALEQWMENNIGTTTT